MAEFDGRKMLLQDLIRFGAEFMKKTIGRVTDDQVGTQRADRGRQIMKSRNAVSFLRKRGLEPVRPIPPFGGSFRVVIMNQGFEYMVVS